MKKMNHTDYPKRLRSKPENELRFIIKDCREAVAAMPDGGNVSYYLDEINYCISELYRRDVKNRLKSLAK